MSQSALRPVPGRLPGKAGSVSRRGTIIARPMLIVIFLVLLSPPLPGTALSQRYDPEPLVPAAPDRLVFFDPQPQACAQDAGCLLELPHNTLPAALVVPRRAHLPAVAARTLLPAANRWLLAAGGGISSPGALMPAPPRVGQPPRADSLPFMMLARADQLPVAGMFLIGVALLLAGTALGLTVRSPSEPFTPQAEPWIPECKALPRLVASPVSPAHLQSRS